MTLLYRYLFAALWASWIAYWWIASARVKATVRRESLSSRLLHIIPLSIAAVLLVLPQSLMPFPGRGLSASRQWPFWCGAAATAAGLAFTVWARRVIGRNWSGIVTIKEDHELITRGPYRIVRHPIYTGLLLAFAGSATARGDWAGVLSVLIAVAALWRKLRIEELGMREQFGDRYVTYREHVAALIPYLI